MNRRRRLDRLSERVLVRHCGSGPSSGFPLDADDDQWLAAFEAMGNAGKFVHEPDFPVAIAFYRAALDAAYGQADPPFDPPAKFHPLDSPRCRQRLWRSEDRFPDVVAGFNWLCEFFTRVHEGVPPVTETEFAELAAWFLAHEDRLWPICLPSELLELGDGEATSFGNVRWGLQKGARKWGGGRDRRVDPPDSRELLPTPFGEHAVKQRHRLDKLIERLQARRGESGPLTIFLVEADAEHPVGTRVIWGGRAREIVFDPAHGEPALPPGGPHNFILGPVFDV